MQLRSLASFQEIVKCLCRYLHLISLYDENVLWVRFYPAPSEGAKRVALKLFLLPRLLFLEIRSIFKNQKHACPQPERGGRLGQTLQALHAITA